MGKLKFAIFIGKVNNSKFIVVHRAKEVHLEERRDGNSDSTLSSALQKGLKKVQN